MGGGGRTLSGTPEQQLLPVSVSTPTCGVGVLHADIYSAVIKVASPRDNAAPLDLYSRQNGAFLASGDQNTHFFPSFVFLSRIKRSVLKQIACPCLQKLQYFEYFMDPACRVPLLMNAC